MDTTGLLTARYLATSLDGGVSWDRKKISNTRFTPGAIPGFAGGYMGDYYETAAYGGKVIPCWSDNTAGPWQAFVAPIALGPSINTTPLPNTENLNGPYVVDATISTAGSGLVTGETKLYWGRGTINNATTMGNTGGNNWTANIPGNGQPAEYRYYIKTMDSLGRIATSPSNAPDSYYTFFAVSDTVRPVITYTPLPDQAKATWPSTVTAEVTDNIGLDSVWVKWYKNSTVNTKHFRLPNTGGNVYSAMFNSLNTDVEIGDSIFYKIYAQDNSLLHNSDSTVLNKFQIINAFLCEDFTGTTFPPTDWSTEFSGTLFWVRDNVSGYGTGQGSAEYQFYDANVGTNQSLITLTFGNTITGDSLKFDHAYCTYIDEVDQLQIQTSTNAGATYTNLIILNGGVSGPLVTAPPNLNAFTPTSSQWATKKYALPIGTNKIKFTGLSQYGNNLFLDNICVVGNTTGIVNTQNGILPQSFNLSQNYPNPFNPTTKINFSIPKQGLVSLKIYDVLGKEVITLVNETVAAGNYDVSFNGSNLSSGAYFYRIESGDFSAIKRMMLIK